MERNVRLPFGAAGLGQGECRTGPDVPEGDTIERESGGPDEGEAVDKDSPEGGDMEASGGAL